MAAMSGVTRSATRAFTTAANAVPMTTAIARSMRFPRSRNSLNCFIISHLPLEVYRRSPGGLDPTRKPQGRVPWPGAHPFWRVLGPDRQLGATLKVQEPRADDSIGVRASARPFAARAGPSHAPRLHSGPAACEPLRIRGHVRRV